VADPGPAGRLWALYLPLGALFAIGLAWSLRILLRRIRSPEQGTTRAFAWLEMWACLVGLLAVTGRFLGWPGWSARIWPLTAAALAAAVIAAYLLRDRVMPPVLAGHIPLLTMGTLAPPLPTPPRSAWALTAVALAVHLGGIAAVLALRYAQPPWLAPLLLLALLLPQAPQLRRRVPPNLMVLAPLLVTSLILSSIRTLVSKSFN